MQQNLMDDKEKAVLENLDYLLGEVSTIVQMSKAVAKQAFDPQVIEFLHVCSQRLRKKNEAKAYPDLMTLGFWMRRSSLEQLKKRFAPRPDTMRLGRGMAFHIAPSNVAVNYAYSLVAGLLAGNTNVVRVPSKTFSQVTILNQTLVETLDEFPWIKPYLCLVQYERNQKVNDVLSAMADVRIIWGGDQTIAEVRKSPLGPRASEITFADRYSLAVIDSEQYLALEEKERFAERFYNDTFLTDQNACTSPRAVIWLGRQQEKAKEQFWQQLHHLVKQKYPFQPIMGVNKLASSYLAAAVRNGVKIQPSEDNYIKRITVESLDSQWMDFKDSCGYFYEYDCHEILKLREICNNAHCQTIGYLGKKEDLLPLFTSGIKGVDRIVPIGKTMDFDLIWDGYDLVERLTRTISIGV